LIEVSEPDGERSRLIQLSPNLRVGLENFSDFAIGEFRAAFSIHR
jgi:hypothetical protein